MLRRLFKVIENVGKKASEANILPVLLVKCVVCTYLSAYFKMFGTLVAILESTTASTTWHSIGTMPLGS